MCLLFLTYSVIAISFNSALLQGLLAVELTCHSSHPKFTTLAGQGSCVILLVLVRSASLSNMYLDTKEAPKPEGHMGEPAYENA